MGCAAALGAAGKSGAEQISELLLSLSTALEQGNAARFLSLIDRSRCPEYAALEDNVVALTAQDEIGSSVGVLEQSRNGESYELKLDWLLEMRPQSRERPAETRHQVVNCRIERFGKRWKVTTISPVAFFRPL